MPNTRNRERQNVDALFAVRLAAPRVCARDSHRLVDSQHAGHQGRGRAHPSADPVFSRRAVGPTGCSGHEETRMYRMMTRLFAFIVVLALALVVWVLWGTGCTSEWKAHRKSNSRNSKEVICHANPHPSIPWGVTSVATFGLVCHCCRTCRGSSFFCLCLQCRVVAPMVCFGRVHNQTPMKDTNEMDLRSGSKLLEKCSGR